MAPWLPPALTYIGDWMDHQMRLSQQPGCALAVTHRGRIVLDRAWGHADLATGTKLTTTHRFRVASHSKSFTAAGIMRLREQGRLRLDDTAGQHVPNLHPAIARVTIAQLLSHGAGIMRDGTDSSYWVGETPFLDEAAIRADLGHAPILEANTRFKYSNHAFALAGLVIEAVTNQPYATWITREIVARAGLSNTFPDTPLPGRPRLATGHSGMLPLGRRVAFPSDTPTHALAPATGFVSTAAELARFFAQLSPAASSRLLSRDSRLEMTRPHRRNAHAPVEQNYGLGIASGQVAGWDFFGHSGGFQGTITRTAVLPDHDIAISILTNATDGWSGAWIDGAIHILKTFATHGPPSPRVAPWTGRWWSYWGAIDLVPMGKRVLVASPGMINPFAHANELEATSPTEARVALAGGYANHGERVRLVRDKAGKPTSLHFGGGTMLPERALAKRMQARYGGQSK